MHLYCKSHSVKVVRMTECEVIQRRAAGQSRKQKCTGATGGLAGASQAAPGFSHVQSKTRPLTAVQGRRAKFGEK